MRWVLVLGIAAELAAGAIQAGSDVAHRNQLSRPIAVIVPGVEGPPAVWSAKFPEPSSFFSGLTISLRNVIKLVMSFNMF